MDAQAQLAALWGVIENDALDAQEARIWQRKAKLYPELLRTHGHPKGGVVIAETALAKLVGVGKSTLGRHLKRWHEAGYIKRKVVKTAETGPTGHKLKAVWLRLPCDPTTTAILAYAAGLGGIPSKPKHGGARVSDPCPCCGSTKRVKETRREATIRTIIRCECEKTTYSDETETIMRHSPDYHYYDAAADVDGGPDPRLIGALRGIAPDPIPQLPPDTQPWPRRAVHDETPAYEKTPTPPAEPEAWGHDAWPLTP